jgi:serine protease Do
MTKILGRAWMVGLASALMIVGASVPPCYADDEDGVRSDVIRSLLPGVVNISVRKVTATSISSTTAAVPPPGGAIKAYIGSGFIIDASGVVVTNYHVVEDAFIVTVTLSDGTRLPARVAAASRRSDLAVLNVSADRPLMALHWGSSGMVRVGDQVLAAGNPFGMGTSVSAGIVSALNRNIQDSPFDHFIQTDAAINHGNSGGPLFDMQGNVVGIASDIVSPTPGFTGLGFAIPSDWARFVVTQLQTYGWVRPGWIGVKLQEVTPGLANALNLPSLPGFIISGVRPDSPAQAAGLEIGDVILRLNGRTPTDSRAFLRHLVETPIGNEITVSVANGTSVRDVHMKVAEWPQEGWVKQDGPTPVSEPHFTVPPDLGLTLSTKPGSEGVLITAIGNNPDLPRHSIGAGSVILRIQNQPVSTPADVQTEIQAARSANKAFVAMLIFTGRHDVTQPEWVALHLKGME